MEQQELERIVRATLKELGVTAAALTIAPMDGQSGRWSIDIGGSRSAGRLKITCGPGSTALWVRQQIFDQYLAQG